MSIVVEPFVRQMVAAAEARPVAPARPHVHRQLRAAAERLLWNHLRDCRLGGRKFRRQHLVDVYLADFICHEARLVIELQSTLTPALCAHAEARRAHFEARGFKVLRLRDRDVLIETRAVLDMLRTALGWDTVS